MKKRRRRKRILRKKKNEKDNNDDEKYCPSNKRIKDLIIFNLHNNNVSFLYEYGHKLSNDYAYNILKDTNNMDILKYILEHYKFNKKQLVYLLEHHHDNIYVYKFFH